MQASVVSVSACLVKGSLSPTHASATLPRLRLSPALEKLTKQVPAALDLGSGLVPEVS